MDIFRDKIEPLLDSTRLSNSELEQRIGIPRSSIYKWKNNISQSYRNYIAQIANYFDVPINTFVEDKAGKSNSLITHASQLSNQMVIAAKDLRNLLEKKNDLFTEKAMLEENAHKIISLLKTTNSSEEEAKVVDTLRKLCIEQDECQQEISSVEQKLNDFAEENIKLYIFIMISELNKQDQKKVYNYVSKLFTDQIHDMIDNSHKGKTQEKGKAEK